MWRASSMRASFDRRSFDEVFRSTPPMRLLSPLYHSGKHYALHVRRARSCVLCITMVGGSHAQLNPERFFDPAVSYICRSDNIYAIADVLMAEGIIPLKNGSCPRNCPPLTDSAIRYRAASRKTARHKMAQSHGIRASGAKIP